MGEERDEDSERERPDSPASDDDVDEASEDSFPASDPPSYGSAEPGAAHHPEEP